MARSREMKRNCGNFLLFTVSGFVAVLCFVSLAWADYLTVMPPPYASSNTLSQKPVLIDSPLRWGADVQDSKGQPLETLLAKTNQYLIISVRDDNGERPDVTWTAHLTGQTPNVYPLFTDALAEPPGEVYWDDKIKKWKCLIQTKEESAWASFIISGNHPNPMNELSVSHSFIFMTSTNLIKASYGSYIDYMLNTTNDLVTNMSADYFLAPSFVSGLTSSAIVIPKAPTSVYMVSYNQFQTVHFLKWDGSYIDSSKNMGRMLLDMITFPSHVVMSTNDGVYFHDMVSDKTISKIQGNVSGIRYSNVLVQYAEPDWNTVILAFIDHPPSIKASYGVSSYFSELQNKTKHTIKDVIGPNCAIIDVGFTSFSPDVILVLYKNLVRKTYGTVHYTLASTSTQTNDSYTSGTWTWHGELPPSIPKVNGEMVETAISVPEKNATDGKRVVLSRISTLPVLSQDIYVWGEVLLYSSDFGATFVIVHSLDDFEIKSFVASVRGSFAFLTSKHEVWYGQIGSVIMKVTDSSLPDISKMLFFDGAGDLHLYLIKGSSNPPQFQEDLLFKSQISDLISQRQSISGLQCPFSTILFNASFLPTYTRTPQVPFGLRLLGRSYIPTTIFFDFGYQYEFDIMITPAPGFLQKDVGISFRLDQSGDNLFLESTREEQSSGDIQYHVVLRQDASIRDKNPPGENLIPSTLAWTIDGGSYKCVNERSPPRIKSLLYYELRVFSGCPPSQQLRFSVEQSIKKDQGCSDKHGIPCLFFDYVFAPVFEIYDNVTGISTKLRDEYHFYIIGGGEDYDSIKEFSESEILNYNNGSGRIWSPNNPLNDDQTILSGTKNYNQINWVCGNGSPCYTILPKFPETPEYYLRIKVTTKATDNKSYCDYSTTFLLRLHGIPMDLDWTVSTTFCTTAFIIGFILVRFYIRSKTGSSRVSRFGR